MGKISAVILAAGEGKRMKSDCPKVLHSLCGRTLIGHVLAALDTVCRDKIVVVGHGAGAVKEALGDAVRYALQERQLGTGHAVMQAAPLLGDADNVFILCGDTPLLTGDVMSGLEAMHRAAGAAVTILTAIIPDPAGYGRIVRDTADRVIRIVEEKDASEGEKKINEINTGAYLFSAKALLGSLEKLTSENAQGEYYLTDCVELVAAEGRLATTFVLNDDQLALGVNDRMQLAEAERLMRARLNTALMAEGVTMTDPGSTYVDAGVRVGRDTVLLPGTMLRGETAVGSGCVIGPNCEITDCEIGDGVTIRHSVLTGCRVEDDVSVGPFAHIRPDTVLRRSVKIGDFVELKKSDIGEGTKIPHLSYVGDADVGPGANLGAGTIVVNYDGRKKHKTLIEAGAFVGCNSNLVAPVRIGRNAFVAAGSTITKDVPDGSLSLARPKQVNKDGVAARFLERDKFGDS